MADRDREAARVAYAATRIAAHADRELTLLTRAAHADSDLVAQALEYEADGAYRDFVAMIEEHGLRER
jgi:hypothetical protein